MTTDFDSDKKTSTLFLTGVLVFIALLGGVYYYFSKKDVPVAQTVVEINVPLSSETSFSGVIDPDTAPPVNPKGMPDFAVPSEDPKPYAPLPASATTESAPKAAAGATE